VAVRAPNGAFGDFGLYCTPTPGVLDHGCNVELLGRWIDMVEIQDHWIVLAAIDTWVSLQICDEPIQESATTQAISRHRFVDVVLGIARVVVANKRSAAALAV
jgi:hypothetical protein